MANEANGPATSLLTYLRARYPIVILVSHEETRVERALLGVAQAMVMDLVFWSITTGLVDAMGNPLETDPVYRDPVAALKWIQARKKRLLIVMRDLHVFLRPQNPERQVVRALRDLSRDLRVTKNDEARSVVLLCPRFELPDDLEKDVTVLRWPMPTREDLRGVLSEALAGFEARAKMKREMGAKAEEIVDAASALEGTTAEDVVSAALGLTAGEAGNVFARSVVVRRRLDPAIISAEKEQVIAKDGVLEWRRPPTPGGFDWVAGLGQLKAYLLEARQCFDPGALEYGLDPPKGILLIGPQGCGKTYIADHTAAEYRMPCVRHSFGRMQSKYIGESQEKQRRAWERAQAIAPVLYFMDEIDKGLKGATGSGDSDGGLRSEMYGELLQQLQDRAPDAAPVFVIACANEIDDIPAPFMRKGRFDEVFVVDLPTRAEREAVLAVHLRMRRRDPDKFDLAAVVGKTEGFSPAELAAVVQAGLRRSYIAGKRPLETDDLLAAVASTVPLSRTKSKDLERMREQLRGVARWASTPDEDTTATRLRMID